MEFDSNVGLSFIQLNWESDHLILGYVYLESNRTKRKTFTWDSSVALLSPTCFYFLPLHGQGLSIPFDFMLVNINGYG